MSLKGTDRYTGWSFKELKSYDSLTIDPKAYPAIMPRKEAVAGHRIYDVDHVWEVQLFERALQLTVDHTAVSLTDFATLFETLNSEENLNVTFWKINSVKRTLFTKFLTYYVPQPHRGTFDVCLSFENIIVQDIREVASKNTMNMTTDKYAFEQLLAEDSVPDAEEEEGSDTEAHSVLKNLELHMLEILCGPFYRILVEGEESEKPSSALHVFYCVLVDMYLKMFPLKLNRIRSP